MFPCFRFEISWCSWATPIRSPFMKWSLRFFHKSMELSMNTTIHGIEGVVEFMIHVCIRLLHLCQATKFILTSSGTWINPSTNLNLLFIANTLLILIDPVWLLSLDKVGVTQRVDEFSKKMHILRIKLILNLIWHLIMSKVIIDVISCHDCTCDLLHNKRKTYEIYFKLIQSPWIIDQINYNKTTEAEHDEPSLIPSQ